MFCDLSQRTRYNLSWEIDLSQRTRYNLSWEISLLPPTALLALG